jgi:hypothetical protein
MLENKTEFTRPRFCLRCLRRVQADDIGAVVLEGGRGVICGPDVDAMIAGIYVESIAPPPSFRHSTAPRMPEFEPRAELL